MGNLFAHAVETSSLCLGENIIHLSFISNTDKINSDTRSLNVQVISNGKELVEQVRIELWI
jgi:hypothetical protein